MLIPWLAFIVAIIIFTLIGTTGIFHARKYKIEGDFTNLAVKMYIFIMVGIIALTIILVILNNPNASITLPNVK